jgi:hypothetical protein
MRAAVGGCRSSVRQRRHRQELQRAVYGSARNRRRRRARFDDDDALAIDAVWLERGDRGPACDDDQPGCGESATLGRFEQQREFGRDAGFRRERQVHECDDA